MVFVIKHENYTILWLKLLAFKAFRIFYLLLIQVVQCELEGKYKLQVSDVSFTTC